MQKPNAAGQLDLYRLVVFHTLVNEGTMARAGERLFITQPAVSAHIRSLENGLGVSLFDRVGRRSVVNSAGQVLYEKTERLLSVADELKSAMEDLRGVATGRLDLGASVVWQYYLPKALCPFKQEYPHVAVSAQVANSDLIERLVLDRSVDIGLIGRASERMELVSEPLGEDEVVAICGPAHPLVAAVQVDPGVLEDEAFVVREAGSAIRRATDGLLGALGVEPHISMELGSQEAIKQAVMAGQGIGMVSRAGIEHELRAGLLAIVGVANLRLSLHLHAIYLKQKRLTFVQAAFLDMIASDGILTGPRLRLVAASGGDA